MASEFITPEADYNKDRLRLIFSNCNLTLSRLQHIRKYDPKNVKWPYQDFSESFNNLVQQTYWPLNKRLTKQSKDKYKPFFLQLFKWLDDKNGNVELGERLFYGYSELIATQGIV